MKKKKKKKKKKKRLYRSGIGERNALHMMTSLNKKHFPPYWPFVCRSLVDSPQKGKWRGALMFSLIGAWTNSWANIGDASDLRHHHTHNDIIVMKEMINLSTFGDGISRNC